MKTQCERVLGWLWQSRTLTQKQAYEKWGIMRLGAVVWRINNEIYCYDYIKSELITAKNRYGQKVRVARYSL